MKKILFDLKGNNKLLGGHMCIILLLAFVLPSCIDEKLVEGSADGGVIKYTYHAGRTIVSGSGTSVGCNIMLSFFFGLGQHHDRLSGIFNNGKFQNLPLYASSLQGHGPFYSDIQPSEPNFKQSEKTEPSINEHIRFMGGIGFVEKGAKDGTKTHLYYLETPGYITYWKSISSKGDIFGGLGPYLAYGIAGNVKSATTKDKAFDKNGDYKPFDAGLTLTAGYKMPKSFSFRLAYDFGLANILRTAGNDKANSRSISLNIGYPLHKLLKRK